MGTVRHRIVGRAARADRLARALLGPTLNGQARPCPAVRDPRRRPLQRPAFHLERRARRVALRLDRLLGGLRRHRPRRGHRGRRARRRPLLRPGGPAPARGHRAAREPRQPPGPRKARLPAGGPVRALPVRRGSMARPPRVRAHDRGSAGGACAPYAARRPRRAGLGGWSCPSNVGAPALLVWSLWLAWRTVRMITAGSVLAGWGR